MSDEVPTVLRMAILLERCEAMLTGLEWYEDRCNVCVLDEDREHAADCPLAALLSDLRKELGK